MSDTAITPHLALGAITHHFQHLEFYFSLFTWGLMGKDQRVGQAVTAQLSFSKLLVLVDVLFRSRTNDAALIKHLGVILDQAGRGEQRRNRAVHSTYLQTSDDPRAESIRYKVTTKLKKGIVYQWEQASIDDLMDIAIELRQTTELLVAFIGETRERVGIHFSGYDSPTETASESPRNDDDIPF